MQKINNSRLKTLRIVIIIILINNKKRKSQFFKETFLLANINIDIAFRISFLILSNIKVNFNNQKLWQRLYTTVKAFSITKQVKLIEKKEFVIIIFDPEDQTFIIYIMSLINFNIYNSNIYSFCKVQIVSLKANKTSIVIFSKNVDFIDIFSLKLIAKLPKYNTINNHIIDLIDNK